MLPDTVFFDAGTDADGNPLRFAFEIHADVTYIDENGDPTGARTWVKQVTLTIDQAVADGQRRFLADPVQLRRQFSPQWGQ